jgi:hypothetical protein
LGEEINDSPVNILGLGELPESKFLAVSLTLLIV